MLIEKLQKYQYCNQAKLIMNICIYQKGMNILQLKKYCHLIKKTIEQANWILSPLIKAIEKQAKKLENQEKKNKLMP